MEDINITKMHHLICSFCDNSKCVRGTDKCEFVIWKKKQEEKNKNENV